MPDRERRTAAYEAWRDAHQAYRDESLTYIKGWWMGDGPPPRGALPEPVTYEALEKLTALREAEGTALAAWRSVLAEA
jgi:hypothetical protein